MLYKAIPILPCHLPKGTVSVMQTLHKHNPSSTYKSDCNNLFFFFSVDWSWVLARSWMSSLQEAPAVLPSFVSSKARVTPTETFVFSFGSVLCQSCFLSLCFLSPQMPKSHFFLVFHQSGSGGNALPSQRSAPSFCPAHAPGPFRNTQLSVLQRGLCLHLQQQCYKRKVHCNQNTECKLNSEKRLLKKGRKNWQTAKVTEFFYISFCYNYLCLRS